MRNFFAGIFRFLYLNLSEREKPSPRDFIKRGQIHYGKDAGLLTIKLEPNIRISSLADTNSMDGLMDYGHNLISTDRFDRSQLIVGDIVIYKVYLTTIVHRIAKIGEDSNGRWYRCRGDNNANMDRWYLRDKNIKYLVIGVFY